MLKVVSKEPDFHQTPFSFHGIVGQSACIREIFGTIDLAASCDYPVVLSGESGTGKELVARAVHNTSARANGPFVPINCGALPEQILESELFGHVRGAFTGAIRDRKGRLKLADGGTLFLDEVAELSPIFQVKLLRALEEKHIQPVRAEHTIQVDFRLISATNQDLRNLVKSGSFREDLFYRLCVVPIHLPLLRKRREDIPYLVNHILRSVRQEIRKPVFSLTQRTMEALLSYEWPGNVRELINAIQYASLRCTQGEILPEHLHPELLKLTSGEKTEFRVVVKSCPKKKRKLSTDRVNDALLTTQGNCRRPSHLVLAGQPCTGSWKIKQTESRHDAISDLVC